MQGYLFPNGNAGFKSLGREPAPISNEEMTRRLAALRADPAYADLVKEFEASMTGQIVPKDDDFSVDVDDAGRRARVDIVLGCAGDRFDQPDLYQCALILEIKRPGSLPAFSRSRTAWAGTPSFAYLASARFGGEAGHDLISAS